MNEPIYLSLPSGGRRPGQAGACGEPGHPGVGGARPVRLPGSGGWRRPAEPARCPGPPARRQLAGSAGRYRLAPGRAVGIQSQARHRRLDRAGTSIAGAGRRPGTVHGDAPGRLRGSGFGRLGRGPGTGDDGSTHGWSLRSGRRFRATSPAPARNAAPGGSAATRTKRSTPSGSRPIPKPGRRWASTRAGTICLGRRWPSRNASTRS